ncbi:hypothetical protein Q767_07330 [Flavobacterium enshiense DK69]|uniref:Uncharacterized protein n=1 Tax=Flavobacterium enshiense DK69 TaxID=1107311 RepID=A0A0A2MTT9_9FLAO|nr:hypothetical protein Q767_07330 [Flavobacterium enshiense DK69]
MRMKKNESCFYFDWQSRGRGFEPHLLYKKKLVLIVFFRDFFYVLNFRQEFDFIGSVVSSGSSLIFFGEVTNQQLGLKRSSSISGRIKIIFQI